MVKNSLQAEIMVFVLTQLVHAFWLIAGLHHRNWAHFNDHILTLHTLH
jgi:hypothetical protein